MTSPSSRIQWVSLGHLSDPDTYTKFSRNAGCKSFVRPAASILTINTETCRVEEYKECDKDGEYVLPDSASGDAEGYMDGMTYERFVGIGYKYSFTQIFLPYLALAVYVGTSLPILYYAYIIKKSY